jgi:hypothetical protein
MTRLRSRARRLRDEALPHEQADGLARIPPSAPGVVGFLGHFTSRIGHWQKMPTL